MSNGRRKWGLGLLLAAGFLALLYAAGSGLPYGPHIERTLCGRFEEVLEAGGWNCNGNAAFQEGLDFSIQEEWYGFGAGAYDLNHRPYSLMLDALCREYPGLGWSRLALPLLCGAGADSPYRAGWDAPLSLRPRNFQQYSPI